MTTAFQDNAFQADGLAFQIDVGPMVVIPDIVSRGNWRLGRQKRRREEEVIKAKGYERPFEPTVIIEFPPPLEIEEDDDDDKIILLAITRVLH